MMMTSSVPTPMYIPSLLSVDLDHGYPSAERRKRRSTASRSDGAGRAKEPGG